ncbi:MAG: hypothetical protein Q9224_007468 [Gallowayella concinna]
MEVRLLHFYKRRFSESWTLLQSANDAIPLSITQITTPPISVLEGMAQPTEFLAFLNAVMQKNDGCRDWQVHEIGRTRYALKDGRMNTYDAVNVIVVRTLDSESKKSKDKRKDEGEGEEKNEEKYNEGKHDERKDDEGEHDKRKDDEGKDDKRKDEGKGGEKNEGKNNEGKDDEGKDVERKDERERTRDEDHQYVVGRLAEGI